MKRMRQMYKFTQYVDEVNTQAENNRDKEGLIPYPPSKDVIEEYAKIKKITIPEASHLESSCVKDGYLYTRYSQVFVDDGKGRHFLDKLGSIPTGFIEELLRQYQYSMTVILSAAFVGLLALLWHIGESVVHHL